MAVLLSGVVDGGPSPGVAPAGSVLSNESARAVTAAGGWSSNDVCRVVDAAAQPAPPGWSGNVAVQNWGGFLGAMVLFPARDADGDGVFDENDPDNDNDALGDDLELEGTAFTPKTSTDPMVADTDRDDVPDSAEAAAGTNPDDDRSRLEITAVQSAPPLVIVTWKGRGGYAYNLMCASNLTDLKMAPITADTVTAHGGTPPWFETETVSTNLTGADQSFYRIQVQEP